MATWRVQRRPSEQDGPGHQGTALLRRLRRSAASSTRQPQKPIAPESPPADATFPAARLYAKLLSAHPFEDGNGRACTWHCSSLWSASEPSRSAFPTTQSSSGIWVARCERAAAKAMSLLPATLRKGFEPQSTRAYNLSDHEAKFTDYHGPTGPYVATDRGILPLASAEGMAELMDSAMLVSLGHTEKAAEYQRLVQKASQRGQTLRSRLARSEARSEGSTSSKLGPARELSGWTCTKQPLRRRGPGRTATAQAAG